MNRLSAILLIVSSLVFVSCNINDTPAPDDVNPDNIYLDYKIWGEENDPDVTVMLQFRFNGPNGTTLMIKDPASITLDGIKLEGDSSKMTGAFYEAIIPVNQFAGKHTIIFTDINNKEYKEEFEFHPLRLLAGLPDTISRQDLVLQVEGLEPMDFARVIITDTSFHSDGISRLDTVRKGMIKIPREELENLSGGPVFIEIHREYERELVNGTAEGGMLTISYALKREIFLRD